MKLKIVQLLALCAIGIVLTVSSCKKSDQDKEALITGKWTMKTATGIYTQNGSTRTENTNFTSADYFDFKSDGKIVIMETGKTYNGYWVISNSKLFITNTGYIDYKNGFEIPVLTSVALKIHYTEISSTSTLDQTQTFAR